MTCWKCYARQPDQSRFCGACGAKLATVAPVRSNTPWRKLVDVGLAFGGVVLVLFFVAAFLYERDPRASGRDSTAAPTSSSSHTVTLRSATFCFADAESLYAVVESNRSGKGVQTVLGLAMREKAFQLNTGDSVSVITTDPVAYVRVLTGFQAGRRCYTNPNLVKP